MNRVILAYSQLPGQLPGSTPRARQQAESSLGVALACRLLSAVSERSIVPGALRYSAHGKPYVPGLPEFSIAHEGGWVLCAVASAGAVGVDVEPLVARSSLPRWRLVFDSAERAAARTPRAALAIWTAKEAVLKAAGATLAEVSRVRVRGRHAEFRGQRWHCRTPQFAPRMLARLATAEPVTSLQLQAVSASQTLAP